MSEPTPVQVVLAWHDALNREDGEEMLRLSDPNIEIVGPRGSGFGLELLRQWLHHARVHLLPRRRFAARDTVVVEERGIWVSPETGEVVGESDVASVFRVRQGRVAYCARFDTLAAALAHAELDETHLV